MGANVGFAAQVGAIRAATEALAALDLSLRGVPGLSCMMSNPGAAEGVERGTAETEALVARFEAEIEAGEVALESGQLEELNAALVLLRDRIWALRRDRLEALKSVSGLATSLGFGSGGTPPVPGTRRSACSGPSTWLSGRSTGWKCEGGTRLACTS